MRFRETNGMRKWAKEHRGFGTRGKRRALYERPPFHVQQSHARGLKLGRLVHVTMDDGSLRTSVVTKEPWQLGHGDFVVGLEGFSGGYDVMRVIPIHHGSECPDRGITQQAEAGMAAAVIGCHFNGDGDLIPGSPEGYWLCDKCGLANDRLSDACDCGHKPSTRTFTPYPAGGAMSAEPVAVETSKEKQARLAIGYLLGRIASDPEVTWHFIATESHAKLIATYALLAGISEEQVTERFKAHSSRCCRRCEEEGS